MASNCIMTWYTRSLLPLVNSDRDLVQGAAAVIIAAAAAEAAVVAAAVEASGSESTTVEGDS
eukprot:19221-Heterococcus_DN1.PRE.1